MKRDNRLTLAAVTLLCAGLCLGCSEDPSVDISTQCLELLADEGTAPGHVISRTGAESTCNFLDIEFVATDISGIRSAEIQVSYPNGLAFLLLVDVGPLLLGTDESVACDLALSEYGVDCILTSDFENGTVDLSLSLTSQTEWTVDAPPAEGAVLARLTFQQITTLPGAQGPFEFVYGKLIDDGNEGTTAPVSIIDVTVDPSTFVGGQMIIVER